MQNQNRTLSIAPADSATAVRIEKLMLLYRQAYLGTFSSTVAGLIWAVVMWSAAPRTPLLVWIAVLLSFSLWRIVIVESFRRRAPRGTELLGWERPYTVALGASSLTWGVGTVMVMPDNSLAHHLASYVFMIALAGATLSAYGMMLRVTIFVVSALLLPIIFFLLYKGGSLATLMGLGGFWFFATTLRASVVHNRTIEESFRLAAELQQATREAQALARTDVLTGLNNRRAFALAAEAALRIAQRDRQMSSMLLIDIDGFKSINDQHGHDAGDAALQHVARLITQELRASDVCGRLGGDEFAVLLPRTDLQAAEEVATKLLKTLTTRPVQHAESDLSLTLSIGVAAIGPTVEELLKNADNAMYIAKRSGKNQVAVSREP